MKLEVDFKLERKSLCGEPVGAEANLETRQDCGCLYPTESTVTSGHRGKAGVGVCGRVLDSTQTSLSWEGWEAD